MLSKGALVKHLETVRRFHQHKMDSPHLALLETQLLLFDTLHEQHREQLSVLLKMMRRSNSKRDQYWWKLPLCAYEGELRFFDSRRGLRNVPLKKKRVPPAPPLPLPSSHGSGP